VTDHRPPPGPDPTEAATAAAQRVLFVGNLFSSLKVSFQYSSSLARHLREAGFEILSTSSFESRPRRLVDMLWTAWDRRGAYDVALVDVFSGPSFVWAEAVGTLLHALGKPFVLTLRGGALPEFARRHRGRVVRLLRSATAVTTPSWYLKQEFSLTREDTHHIPNGIEISDYPTSSSPGMAPKLVWLRAFHKMYAPQLAIEVLGLVRRERPDASLHMVGPDKDGSLAVCRALAQKLGLSQVVSFVPGVPKAHVPEELVKGKVFLNTTTVESFGVVVTTGAGELSYLWQHETDALVVPVNDAGAMADAVLRVLHEPGLAARLAVNARRKAESYDWSHVLPQWESLLASIGDATRREPKS
jgi:glycosyltransferase involved in cell wall biosynthesis